ncbi:MAG TPA: hypothetical protein VFE62_03070 [Gemmataceae bacterium]|nr:hypothetical protein [Gemmataceae bacterium]
MTQTFTLAGMVSGGKLPPPMTAQIVDALSRLEGKVVEITLKERKKRRSNNQNAYMWGVVVKLITDAFRDAGNNVDAEDVFIFLKLNVWKAKQVFVTPDGEVLQGIASSRHWTTQEMELRLEEARAWAAQTLGLEIPLPNEDVKQSTEGAMQ